MEVEVDALLAQVEVAIQAAEADVAVLGREVWTFDAAPEARKTRRCKPIKKAQEETAQGQVKVIVEKYGKKRVVRERERTPGAGAYNPRYESVEKRASCFKMVKQSNKTSKKRKRESQVLDIRPEESIKHTSRLATQPSFSFGQPPSTDTLILSSRTLRDTSRKVHSPMKEKRPDVGSYNPSLDATKPRSLAFSFAAPPPIERAFIQGRKDSSGSAPSNQKNDTATATDSLEKKKKTSATKSLNIEAALQSIEPRVKGICSWQASETKTASKVTDQERKREHLDLEKSFKAIEPTVVGGVRWQLPYFDPSKKAENKSKTTEQTAVGLQDPKPLATKDVFVPPSSAFARPVGKSIQLARKQAQEKILQAKLGPGVYTICPSSFVKHTPDDTKGYTLKNQSKRKTLFAATKEAPGVGDYNVDSALQHTRPRLKCGVSMGSGAPRWLSEGKPERPPKTLDSANNKQDEGVVSDSSSLSSFGDEKDGENGSDTCSDQSSVGESKYERSARLPRKKRRHRYRRDRRHPHSSDSDVSDVSDFDDSVEEHSKQEDGSLEKLGKWMEQARKKVRGSTRAHVERRLEKESRMLEQLSNGKQTASSRWAKKSFLETADAKRYVILQRHRYKKSLQAQGPMEDPSIKYGPVERRPIGIVSQAVADKAKAEQEAKNKSVREKMQSQRFKKEKALIERLGLDPEEFLHDQSGNQEFLDPYSEFDPSVVASKAGFKYRPESELPPQALAKARQRQEDLEKMGPGFYGSAVHRQWTELERDDDHKDVDISKQTGRDRKIVVKKGVEKTIEFTKASFFGADVEKGGAELGPGVYDVAPNVTRFGVEQVRAPDISKSTKRDYEERKEDGQPQLDLDATTALEYTKKQLPGAKGFSFSAPPVKEYQQGRGSGDQTHEQELILEPRYEFGKFYEPGKNLVPLDKSRPRFLQESKFGDDDDGDQMMPLSPARAREYLAPRVPVVDFSAGTDRGLFYSHEEKERIAETFDFQGEPLSNLDAIKPRTDAGVINFETWGGDERFPVDDQGDATEYTQAVEYDTDKGLRITKEKRTINHVNMGLQRGRKDLESNKTPPAYRDAIYPGAEGDLAMLGGRNAKGAHRSAPAKGVLDMSKAPPKEIAKTIRPKLDPFEDAGGGDKSFFNMEFASSGPVLDLVDKIKGDEALRPRQQKGVVGMQSQVGRWDHQERAEKRRLRERAPASPTPDSVVQAMSKLSIRDKSKRYTKAGHIDMSKWLGRAQGEASDTAPSDTKDAFKVEIDAGKARDAPSLNPRVLGGALARSKRSQSPSSKFAKEKAQQGNVLELNPDRSSLEPRVSSVQFGSPPLVSPSRAFNDELMYLKPARRKESDDALLRHRVRGGAVGLNQPVAKPVLVQRKRMEKKQHEQLLHKENQQTQKHKETVRKQRLEQLVKVKTGAKAATEKNPSLFKRKGGRVIARAVKVD